MAAGEFTPATVRVVFFDRDGSACFDPDRVRVQRNDKTWWLLTGDGRAEEVEEERAWA